MLCLKARTLFSPSFSNTFSPPIRLPHLKPSFSFKLYTQSPPSKPTTNIKMSLETIEHVVLFKVKDNTDPSKINAMVNGLNALISLEQVVHITAGPVLRTRSQPLTFTHVLHSRYKSKDDLAAYSAHPSHVSVVKENVLPIVDDIMAVDWVSSSDDEGHVYSVPSGSAVKLTLLKLKENLGEDVKSEIFRAIKGIKDSFPQISQISYGENFSPARAKGYTLASLAVYPGVSDLEAVDSNHEFVNSQKDKVRDYLESVVVVDYVVPSPQSASL
ncbi:stress-response A/B barrel domain-containing protein UP3 [Quercus robur]|uniref:stress-response A/B barrel domain-containing protein UP3 n=1 Tax=Quercus robur TaxID=38942 RepID=UPI002162E006|nr:stress-response A/B barrel domain-containing protein UP3 [Quercus robur]